MSTSGIRAFRDARTVFSAVDWKNPASVYKGHMSLLSTVGIALLLTLLETLGSACLIQWAQSREYANGALALGVAFFSGVGCLLGVGARLLGRLSIVNAVWQSTSIASVTLLCVFVHGETLTQVQMLGVALAVLSSICLLEDNSTPDVQPEERELLP